MYSSTSMRVIKRSGEYENVSFDKIMNRIISLSVDNPPLNKINIDSSLVSQKVIQELRDGVTTKELDVLSSQVSIAMYSKNPDYAKLASRIVVSNHHKNTLDSFSSKVEKMFGVEKPLINKEFYELVMNNSVLIDSKIDYNKDYKFDYFGLKTLEKSYLYKIKGEIIERPQDMIMRVCLSIHRNDIDRAFESYDYMSDLYFTHATPTLFNAGSNREQFASCFLLSMKDDSIDGIYKTLNDCALISQHSGGIGLHIHNIRAKDSYIAGTAGKSNGIVPMLRVFNDTARYVDQGGGKRNGSFAIYLEPWHADIMSFLDLKKNHGNEAERARDLFYALWIPDLFMEKVVNDGMWHLFCPNETCDLSNYVGEEFVSKYNELVESKQFREQIPARKVWAAILNSQIETGTPYLLYKDSCNKKSNQQNLGIIKSSNLCTEIIEYSDKDETAVCNLASIALKHFVVPRLTENLKIRIFSKSSCVYCEMAKSLCERLNIDHEVVEYTKYLLSGEYPHGVTFPQVIIMNNEPSEHVGHLGGYTELERYLSGTFDFEKLGDVTEIITRNLNNVIDYNYYPTPETERSNLRHRPIGIGVQGLANVFFELNLPFDSEEAKELNENIFETIYFHAMKCSVELSKGREVYMKKYKTWSDQLNAWKSGSDFVDSSELHRVKQRLGTILPEEVDREEYLGSYSSFIGSPLSKGVLQYDLWNEKQNDNRHDWSSLKEDIVRYGARNSLLLAPMPTASTAQILGNYECFEPIMSNIYSRRVISGEFMVINEYLVNDLIHNDLWSREMKDKIIEHNGSVQNISEIPKVFKDKYKTVWELKQKVIVDMAADRGKYICQSQSMNLFLESPSAKTLTSMHIYAWKKGLKTGIYYLRTRPASNALQFTVAPEVACESCTG